mmetsp:Transcript_69484/g.197011  ORF Transcript_69484/g.197011 Transcript_69484/m.197011 type:complete len:321 (-) Transcript_69484:801-1763(-)
MTSRCQKLVIWSNGHIIHLLGVGDNGDLGLGNGELLVSLAKSLLQLRLAWELPNLHSLVLTTTDQPQWPAPRRRGALGPLLRERQRRHRARVSSQDAHRTTLTGAPHANGLVLASCRDPAPVSGDIAGYHNVRVTAQHRCAEAPRAHHPRELVVGDAHEPVRAHRGWRGGVLGGLGPGERWNELNVDDFLVLPHDISRWHQLRQRPHNQIQVVADGQKAPASNAIQEVDLAEGALGRVWGGVGRHASPVGWAPHSQQTLVTDGDHDKGRQLGTALQPLRECALVAGPLSGNILKDLEWHSSHALDILKDWDGLHEGRLLL